MSRSCQSPRFAGSVSPEPPSVGLDLPGQCSAWWNPQWSGWPRNAGPPSSPHCMPSPATPREPPPASSGVRWSASRTRRCSPDAGIAHWSPGSLPEHAEPGLREAVFWSMPGLDPPDEEDRVNSSGAYGFIFDMCGVEVGDTGRVRIDEYVTMHDAGARLNPALVDGQIRARSPPRPSAIRTPARSWRRQTPA